MPDPRSIRVQLVNAINASDVGINAMCRAARHDKSGLYDFIHGRQISITSDALERLLDAIGYEVVIRPRESAHADPGPRR